MKKILLLHFAKEKSPRKSIKWGNYKFYYGNFRYDDIVSYASDDETDIIIDIDKLKKVFEVIYDGFDAVYCESPEAMLLRFIQVKKNYALLPFLIADTDSLRKAKNLNKWLKRVYKEAFLGEFVKLRCNFWLISISAFFPFYLKLGIPKENLFYTPSSLAITSIFAPETRRFINQSLREVKTSLGIQNALYNQIVAPGSNNRDYETLAEAVKGTNIKVHVVYDPEINTPIPSRNLYWHSYLPQKEYVEVIRNARFIVVPLKDMKASAGEATITISMKLAKAVITTENLTTKEYIVNKKTGILVKPKNSKDLQNAILYLLRHPMEAKRIGENARLAAGEIDKEVEKNLRQAFYEATNFSNN